MNELFDALGGAAVAADAGAGRGGRGAARSMGLIIRLFVIDRKDINKDKEIVCENQEVHFISLLTRQTRQ